MWQHCSSNADYAHNSMNLQVAYGFAESLRAMGEGNLHEPKADVTLMKLLENYGVQVADQATGMHTFRAQCCTESAPRAVLPTKIFLHIAFFKPARLCCSSRRLSNLQVALLSDCDATRPQAHSCSKTAAVIQSPHRGLPHITNYSML